MREICMSMSGVRTDAAPAPPASDHRPSPLWKRLIQSNSWIDIWRFVGVAVATALGLLVLVGILSFIEYWLKALFNYWGLLYKTDLVVLAIAGASLAFAVIEAAILHYVLITQKVRRKLVSSYYRPETIAEYLLQFWLSLDDVRKTLDGWSPGQQLDDDKKSKVEQTFNEILDDYFGTKRFLFPNTILLITGLFVLYFAIEGGLVFAMGFPNAPDKTLYMLGITVDVISIAAIFGAYTWIAADVINRDYQGTLNASHLYWYAMRFVVAVPLGQAVAVTKSATDAFSSNSGAAIAFLISMFSYERISAIASSLVNRATGAPAAAPDENTDLIIKLPGVDQPTAETFAAEGITTIAKLASSDPILVAVRTGLPFDQVILLVDAALLWRYADTKLLILREFGWAGASNVLNYYDASQRYRKAVAEETEARQMRDAMAADAPQRAAADAPERAAADKKHKDATEELTAAKSRLNGGSEEAMGQLLQDMADAAKPITKAGLHCIIEQVRADTYAQFIRRLMAT
jgi:hypothetical protein